MEKKSGSGLGTRLARVATPTAITPPSMAAPLVQSVPKDSVCVCVCVFVCRAGASYFRLVQPLGREQARGSGGMLPIRHSEIASPPEAMFVPKCY